MQNAHLTRPSRLFWVLISILLGIIPVLLFIAWIQGNMTLPGEIHRALMEKFSWPWLPLQESSTSVRTFADVLLLIALGALMHLSEKLSRVLPPQIRRSARLTVLGIALFCVMSSWQYTGLIFWGIRLPSTVSQIVSPILYYGFVAAALIFTSAIRDPLNALGLKPLYSSTQELTERPQENALSRESVILLALAALLTPLMSLDRFLVIAFIGALIFFESMMHGVKR